MAAMSSPRLPFYFLLVYSFALTVSQRILSSTLNYNFVLGSLSLVTGIEGEDVILPCHANLKTLAKVKEIKWSKIINHTLEDIYKFIPAIGEEIYWQDYKARAIFSKEGLKTGDLSLKLKNTQVSDKGNYSCIVNSTNWADQTQIRLHIESSRDYFELSSPLFVIVKVNEDVILPCHVTLKTRDKLKEIKWSKKNNHTIENIYQFILPIGEEIYWWNYKARIVVFNEGLDTGNFSLKLKNVQMSDEGSYSCFVNSTDWANQNQIFLHIDNTGKQVKAYVKKLENHVKLLEVNLFLDPKRLEVYEDGENMRDTGNIRHVSNSKERFESHTFVLEKRSFSECKYYWEVEVGQKNVWDVGVASESAPRTGEITLSPQNGYWVIGLDNRNNYWASSDPCTILNVPRKPTRIGIFLNLKSHEISFYDTHRIHKLYTFLNVASEKLYPFFLTRSLITEFDNATLIPSLFQEEKIVEDLLERQYAVACNSKRKILQFNNFHSFTSKERKLNS
ncbi:butyrophilin subfamily 1 member A1-like [Pantherophis guttatus]|uniref:Butyrophilin subfamily 1 member A1-like n=1 Tax=Pantherophis guttatus TaxID=94885 RepID=A0ABM3ZMR0_PANGU|nr:butyrophilin subfamily 1 member A1-like [Pantherophis guttatus]